MKILFVNLPYKFKISRASRWPEKTKSGTLYYPYWLAYSAGVLIKNKYDVDLIDCIARNFDGDDLIKYINSYKPDLIVTELTTPTCDTDGKLLTKIKKKFPNIKIAVGGTHITALPGKVLKDFPAIDIALLYEYDFTVLDIVKNFKDYKNVNGIAYLKNDKVIVTDKREYISDLDELPFVSLVYQKFLNPADYYYAFAKHPMIQVFSSRGCPFRCNFCSYPQTMTGRLYRKRSVKDFVDELEYINKKMPEIKEIFIEDDTFSVDTNRVVEICKEIINRKLKLVWSANVRASLPYDVMKEMKKAGCRLLVVGYESGNQSVLDETKKGIKLEDSIAFAESARKLDIKVFGCFMIGLKGDNLKTIQDTFNFAKKLYPDMVFFQQAVPFPGTDFYDWAKESGYLITENYNEWLDNDGYLRCLVNYPYANAKEIEKIRDGLMSKYYFSFTYIVKTFLKNLTWSEFKRVVHSGTVYIWFRIKKLFKREK